MEGSATLGEMILKLKEAAFLGERQVVQFFEECSILSVT